MVGLAGQALSTGSYTTCRVCSALLYVQHQTQRKRIRDCACAVVFPSPSRFVSFPKFYSCFITCLLRTGLSGQQGRRNKFQAQGVRSVCVRATYNIHVHVYKPEVRECAYATTLKLTSTSWSRDRLWPLILFLVLLRTRTSESQPCRRERELQHAMSRVSVVCLLLRLAALSYSCQPPDCDLVWRSHTHEREARGSGVMLDCDLYQRNA